MFYSWASQKIKTTMNSLVFLWFFYVILPLSNCVLLYFPRIIILLVLGKTSHINKMYTVFSICQILVNYSKLICNLFGSLFDMNLSIFSLLFFKTTDKCSFTSIFSTSYKDIQTILFYFLSFKGNFRFFLFYDFFKILFF